MGTLNLYLKENIKALDKYYEFFILLHKCHHFSSLYTFIIVHIIPKSKAPQIPKSKANYQEIHQL